LSPLPFSPKPPGVAGAVAAPAEKKAPAPPFELDIDLPAVAPNAGPPAPKFRAPQHTMLGTAPPAPGPRLPSHGGMPAVKLRSNKGMPAVARPDLPALARGEDLPSVKPAAKASARELPAVVTPAADLPVPKAIQTDLPSRPLVFDLPEP